MGGGKKSKSPKAPDYSGLIAAAQKSADYAYDNAQKQQAWAETAYADNKALGDDVTEFALGQMDKQQAWADTDRARLEEIYYPAQEEQLKRAQEYASAERQEVEAGKAEADVAAQSEQARQVAAQRLEGYGVDPSQLKQGALDQGTRIAEAAAAAGAGNQARFRTEQYGDQLIDNAIKSGVAGSGLAQQAQAGSAQAGQFGNQAVNTGLAEATSGGQLMGTGGSWQGVGNQGLGMQGQLTNASFQNQLAAYDAKQKSSSGWGSALGAIGSVASLFVEEGGAIPDGPDQMYAEGGGPIPKEASPSRGAIPDDISAKIHSDDGSQQDARLNAGEFVVPKDVVKWVGEKGMQQFILKVRKEMNNPSKAPAQPEMAMAEEEVAEGEPPMIPPRGIAAIPDQPGVA